MTLFMFTLRTMRFLLALKMMLQGVEVDAKDAAMVNAVLSVLPEADLALLVEVCAHLG